MKHQKLKQKARQIEILSSLSKLEFASRRQLQAIHCLGSIRNAVLLQRLKKNKPVLQNTVLV